MPKWVPKIWFRELLEQHLQVDSNLDWGWKSALGIAVCIGDSSWNWVWQSALGTATCCANGGAVQEIRGAAGSRPDHSREQGFEPETLSLRPATKQPYVENSPNSKSMVLQTIQLAQEAQAKLKPKTDKQPDRFEHRDM